MVKRRRRVKARAARKAGPAVFVATERTWAPVPDPAGTEPIYVAFPVPPDPQALAEAASYVASLEANGRIARDPASSPAGATHELRLDAEGRRRLVRRRFAAR